MNDRELEQRIRAWYRDAVTESETAPEDLRQLLAAIPLAHPVPLRRSAGRKPWALLAVAATLLVGGALAAGSGQLRLMQVVPPSPPVAELSSAGPTGTPPVTPSATPAVGSGDLIAFVRGVQKQTKCVLNHPSCPTPRLWFVRANGGGAHEVFPDGTGRQDVVTWTPDGSGLLYMDDQKLYLTDPNGDQPQEIDTGCVAATPTEPAGCFADSQAAFSRDGRQIAFVRDSTDESGNGTSAIVTLDLESGEVHALTSTSPAGGMGPGWSPDGSQIVFSRYGTKADGGPSPRIRDAVFVVDSDGQDLRQVSPTDMDAIGAAWSPDGQSIAFLSPVPEGDGNIYAIRPDGSDLRQLTTGGGVSSPTWTPDGRLLFSRSTASADADGWWTMAADGTQASLMVAASSLGLNQNYLLAFHPILQPQGGPAIAPPPWTPRTAIAVGPAAPTPEPTPTPDLANGFSWDGTTSIDQAGPLTGPATLLGDGRVLLTAGCGKAAAVFDPATGTSTATSALTVPRGGETATLLRDGRVLLTGGYNCGAAGQDGVWRSAELYDPATGTFQATGPMHKPREQHTATVLADGRVLIAGGYTANEPPVAGAIILASARTVESTSSILASAEIYDPATGTFSTTGPMTTFRNDHTATLLQDGRVLVVGGGGEAYASTTSADLYDPATGTFSKTGSMKTGRWLHTATLLPDGRVLITGGRSPKDSVYRSAELYDPASGTFSSTGSMHDGRQQHTATLLSDGRVLVAGGYWSDGQDGRVLASTELYDPATGDFTELGSMGTPRDGASAMRLGDGRVLIVGGSDIGSEGSVGDPSAVIYQP